MTALRDQARELIQELEGLPTLPVVVAELIRRSNDPATTVDDITEIIESDPSLNAKILKLVNSAFYALPRRISSLKMAVSILGFNSIRNVVLAASIFNMFKKSPSFDQVGFWIHCLSVGVGCRAIGSRHGASEEGSEFVYGLLHDIGKIVLATHLENQMAATLVHARANGISFNEAEVTMEVVSHAQLGSALAERWRFPESLVHAIRYHHNVEAAREHELEVSTSHVSDVLARTLQLGWTGDNVVPAVSEKAWDTLGLKDSDIDEIMNEINNGLVAASAFVELISESNRS